MLVVWGFVLGFGLGLFVLCFVFLICLFGVGWVGLGVFGLFVSGVFGLFVSGGVLVG